MRLSAWQKKIPFNQPHAEPGGKSRQKGHTMKLFLLNARYVLKMLTMPLDTVFELDWGKPTQRRVSRFEYIRATLKILR